MGFLVSRRSIGFKLETTPYTAETLAATDYDLAAYDINYSPEVSMYARKIADGTFGRKFSVAGKRTITITFAVDMQEGAAAATPATYMKCLTACAMKQTIYGSTGVKYAADSEITASSATIEICEKSEGLSQTDVLIKARGCMGNARFVINSIGEPCKIEFEFKGVLVDIGDRLTGSYLTPTGFNTANPDAVMGVSVVAFNNIQTVNKCVIDLGNDVQIYTDPAKTEGVSGAHVVNRNPTIELDPDLQLVDAQQDFWARWISDNTTGTFTLAVGNNTVFTATPVRVESAFAPGEREGHVVHTLRLSVIDDGLSLLQGAVA